MFNFENCSAFKLNDEDSLSYLHEVADILAQYSWIYIHRNTDIFIYDVLENIPTDWCEALAPFSIDEIHRLSFNVIKDSLPSNLANFIQQCQRLANFRFPQKTLQDLKEISEKPHFKATKVASKKQMEVDTMSSLIHRVCQSVNSQFVLDIGAGLGYLDQFLHRRFGLKTFGLDLSPKYTSAAKDRIKKDPCMDSMQHRTMEVTYSEQCIEDLQTILSKDENLSCSCVSKKEIPRYPTKGPAVMVGLHTCGNLTQDMMKIFCQMTELAAFICVGCCYNKINLSDFPMSKMAKSTVTATRNKYPEWSPCVSGLRLASHGTQFFSDHSHLYSPAEKCMAYRAFMEYYVKKENISWHQPKRHVRDSDLPDFETYCKNMLKNHPLGENEKALESLLDVYHQKEHLLPRVKILLLLQILLQPLWEGFVTVDRMLYFRENNVSTEVLAMWDDGSSSRNLALCAYKR